MTERIRLIVLLAMTVVILGMVNSQIMGKEKTVREGTLVLLRLAPVDPRSLMQGDYMALRYAMTDDVAQAATAAGVNDGVAVIRLGDQNEAQFVVIHDGRSLADDEVLLRFRKRGESVRIASDAFFFEEGAAERYNSARFGELRVAENGDAVLTGLRDAAGQRIL